MRTRLLYLLLAACAAPVGCAQAGDDGPIVIRALDEVHLQIEHRGWGEVMTYIAPEYAFPNVYRGRIEPNEPLQDDSGITLSGTAVAPQPGTYMLLFEPRGDYIDVTATATNTGRLVWNPATTCIMCMRLGGSTALGDSTRERTFAVRDTGLTAIADLPSEPLHAAHALDAAYLFYIPEDSVERYFGHGEVANSLIIRSTADDRRHVAIAWEDARNVSYNFHADYRCVHSEPRFAGVRPGETRIVCGRIYLFEGTREALVARFNADFPEQAIKGAPE